MDNKVIKEQRDYRYLTWSKTRNSSGTAGSLLKAFEIKNGIKIYYKLSNFSQIDGIIGMEAVNEIIVDRFLNLIGIPHLEYKLNNALIKIDSKEYNTYFCSSIDFKKDGDSKTPLDIFYSVNKKEDENILDFLKRYKFINKIYQMYVIDYLILNRDRHGANIEIIQNINTQKLTMAPFFDHGMSLLFSCRNNNDIKKFDVLEDKKIQSFVGSDSAFKNLLSIPKNKLPKINKLKKEDKKYIFYNLEDIISGELQNKIFELLFERCKVYEKLCNKR